MMLVHKEALLALYRSLDLIKQNVTEVSIYDVADLHKRNGSVE